MKLTLLPEPENSGTSSFGSADVRGPGAARMQSANPGAVAVGQPQTRTPRQRRVRSVLRKRGGRGKRQKKPKIAVGEGGARDGKAEAPPAARTPGEGEEEREVGAKSKRRPRERKTNSNWKPFSEMTWQEKLEREEFESKRAEARDVEVVVPPSRGQRAKKKKRGIMDMPRAPRNTTQGLIAQQAGEEGEWSETAVESSRIASMQGLINRDLLAGSSDDDDDDDDEDDDESTHGAGKMDSLGGSSVTSPCEADGVLSPCAHNGHTGPDEKDRRIRELETQNSSLQERVRALEAKGAAP